MTPPGASTHDPSAEAAPWPLWAACHLLTGETVALIVTRLTVDGAFVWSLKPPKRDTVLGLTIRVQGARALSRIEGRVTSITRDPTDVARCGFAVTFVGLDDASRKELSALIEDVSLPSGPFDSPSIPPGSERRSSPRVETRLDGQLEHGGESALVRVANLSMSGALLEVSAALPAGSRSLGALIDLTVLAAAVPEAIDVTARVARVVGAPEPTALAVRFADVDAKTERRIEGLILYALVGSHAMF